MMNFSGYFLAASKFGGLTRKPCTLSPNAPVNQKDSRGDMATWERTSRLMDSTGSLNVYCIFQHFVGSSARQPCPDPRCLIEIGADAVISVNKIPPSFKTAMSSLYPCVNSNL